MLSPCPGFVGRLFGPAQFLLEMYILFLRKSLPTLPKDFETIAKNRMFLGLTAVSLPCYISMTISYINTLISLHCQHRNKI